MNLCLVCGSIKQVDYCHKTKCRRCYSKEYKTTNKEKVLINNRKYQQSVHYKHIRKKHDKKYRERHKEQKKIQAQRRINFKGQKIWLGFNPRKSVCSHCGKSGQTSLHHKEYDKKNPLAHTIELCQSCHVKLHHKQGDMIIPWLK